MISDKSMDAPNAENLPNSDLVFPYYFVADVAFPLERNIMKPYETVTDVSEEVFNQRLCSARMRIETAFGLLTSRWKVLSTSISFSPENAKKVVLATIVLHNFLVSGNVNYTTLEKRNTHNLTSVNSHDLLTANTSNQLARNLRNELCEYLNSSLV
uniref:DDE Tnp4 domain-containing protein n=3 Tax=Bactrocera latifrons TaxID=174628 RepID=A0A0K8UZG0_BACLA